MALAVLLSQSWTEIAMPMARVFVNCEVRAQMHVCRQFEFRWPLARQFLTARLGYFPIAMSLPEYSRLTRLK